jgi:hypothetical protein
MRVAPLLAATSVPRAGLWSKVGTQGPESVFDGGFGFYAGPFEPRLILYYSTCRRSARLQDMQEPNPAAAISVRHYPGGNIIRLYESPS